MRRPFNARYKFILFYIDNDSIASINISLLIELYLVTRRGTVDDDLSSEEAAVRGRHVPSLGRGQRPPLQQRGNGAPRTGPGVTATGL